MVQNISDTREMWIYLVGFCQSTDTYSGLNWMNHCVDMLVCGRNEYVYICIVWSSCFGDVPTLRATFAGILHWWLYPKFLYRFQSKVAQIHWLWSILTIAISVSIGIAISFYFLQTLDFFIFCCWIRWLLSDGALHRGRFHSKSHFLICNSSNVFEGNSSWLVLWFRNFYFAAWAYKLDQLASDMLQKSPSTHDLSATIGIPAPKVGNVDLQWTRDRLAAFIRVLATVSLFILWSVYNHNGRKSRHDWSQ